MSLWLRWGGGILLVFGALLVSREYERYLGRRISEYSGLALLIGHAKSMISKFLAHGEGLWRSFSNDALERVGLLAALREGRGLGEAFDLCRDKMSLPRSGAARLSEELHRLGGEYMGGELERLTALEQSLVSEGEAEEALAEKNIKVARALLLGGALVALISVI